MEVTQTKDRITHAFIGGGEQHSFGIAQTGAFFRMLSDTLYSDKKLAVVREILCNAWDAHIEAGCTDTPIRITLNPSSLSIRDFGKGLSHSSILKNYTTYGGTTKLQDKNQTGGFGLGSKSPFCYVDHFQTTSHHEGVKSLYNMSLSSAEVDGNPSVTRIVELPTTETGIEVNIKIKENDYSSFVELVRTVARNGAMNIELNGEVIWDKTFAEMPDGFVAVATSYTPVLRIRYGAVIYPIHEGLENFKDLRRLLDICSINKGYSGYSTKHYLYDVVLQAPAGKISITPSRESLSMTPATIDQINRLITKAYTSIKDYLNSHLTYVNETLIHIAKQYVNKPFDLQRAPSTITSKKQFLDALINSKMATFTLPMAAQLKAKRAIEKDRKLREDLTRRLKHTQKYVHKNIRHSPPQSTAYQHRRLLQAIKEDPNLSLNNLVHGHNAVRFGEKSSQTMTISSRAIMIANSRTAIQDEGVGLGYIVPRSDTKVKAIVDLCTRLGYTVNNIAKGTVKRDPAKAPAVKAPKAKIITGLPLASNFIQNGYQMFSWANENLERTETPEVIWRISPLCQRIPDIHPSMDRSLQKMLVTHFGDRIAIARSTKEFEHWISQGAKKIENFLREYIVSIADDEKAVEYYKRAYANDSSWLKAVMNTPKLRKLFKLDDIKVSDDIKFNARVISRVMCSSYYYTHDVRTAFRKLNLNPDQASLEFCAKWSHRKMGLFDQNWLATNAATLSPEVVKLMKHMYFSQKG